MSNDESTPVAGSSPAIRTNNPSEIEEFTESRTDSAQKPGESESRKVKFPQIIRHRRVEAKIYGKRPDYPFYRVSYYVAGKRRMRHFAGYAEAKAEAESIVRELASGSQATALTAPQSRDALAALERLEGFRQATGKRVSLLAAVSQFAEAAAKLSGHTIAEAIERFLSTAATVKRQDIAEAVEEFIAAEEPRTLSTEGQRAQLSAKYAYNRAIILRRFSATFPNTAISDLTKAHLDTFLGSLGKAPSAQSRNGRIANSPKSRNHHRATIRQFLQWAVRKDYLSPAHRLSEADAMRPERANTAEVALYSPNEFRTLLEASEGTMRALVAIGGFCGLRTAELLRLDWADVWRVPGHIEVSSSKSKTRQRRLVEICPALAAWLEIYRTLKSGRIWQEHEISFQRDFTKLCEQTDVKRKPNGCRHSFCTFHLALHANENLTAAQAGNTPAMVHGHYKGLATKAEAERWFGTCPATEQNIIVLRNEKAG